MMRAKSARRPQRRWADACVRSVCRLAASRLPGIMMSVADSEESRRRRILMQMPCAVDIFMPTMAGKRPSSKRARGNMLATIIEGCSGQQQQLRYQYLRAHIDSGRYANGACWLARKSSRYNMEAILAKHLSLSRPLHLSGMSA